MLEDGQPDEEQEDQPDDDQPGDGEPVDQPNNKTPGEPPGLFYSVFIS